MKSADEYAERADFALAAAREQSGQDRTDAILMAQVYATQQGAAAMLEAARLTLDAQASNLLSALEDPESGVCIGCGCAANIERSGVLMCEEYPGCSVHRLMGRPQ